MRYTLIFILLFTFTFNSKAQDKKIKVVATVSMVADMTKNIMGNDIELMTIVPIGGDPHLYEPTPKDARIVANADLVLKNGLTFEGWLNELIDNSGTKAKVVTVTKGVKAIESLDYEGSSDPHAWMDAANGLTYIENIKNALIELNPANKEVYEFNYGVYKNQLTDLDNYITKEINRIPEHRRVLITSHDAFQYYGQKYGVQLEAILGTSTDADAQTSDIIRLNKVIKEKKIPAIFAESTINPKMLKEIAKDNDIQIGGELFADSIGDEESGANTYIDMLKHNTDVIVKALTRETAATASAEGHHSEGDDSGSSSMTWGLVGLLMLGGFVFVVTKLSK